MKLATLKSKSKDGELIVVSRCGNFYAEASDIAPTLQFALDHWESCEKNLNSRFESLNAGAFTERKKLNAQALHSPLPRAYEWIDGSAYLNHVELVRKARGATMPPSFLQDPLVYQGGSGCFLAPYDSIDIFDEAWGCDFESEVAVVLSDTPMGTKAKDAEKYIRLIMICNDVSLRNLIPAELEKGFGFFTSKPASSFAPFAVTLDELKDHWKEGRLHLPLHTKLNSNFFGNPDAGEEMHFSFYQLIEHICKTRSYTAGTILGSGTVSNRDRSRGSSCLAEVRMIEKIELGNPKTPYLKHGDEVEISMFNSKNENIFGTIKQRVNLLRSIG